MPCPYVGYILRRDTDNTYAKLDYEGESVHNGGALDLLAREDLSEEVAVRIKKKEKNPYVQEQKNCLTALEVTSPKPRCQQDDAPSETCRGKRLPCLFHLLLAPKISWLMAASLQFLFHFYMTFSSCVFTLSFLCVSLSFCLIFFFK